MNNSQRIAQVAGADLSLPPDKRPAMYALGVAMLKKEEILKENQGLEQYPGDDALKVISLSAMKNSEQLAQLNQETDAEERERHNRAMESRESELKPTESDKEIQDYLESKGWGNTATNRSRARFDIRKQMRQGGKNDEYVNAGQDATDYADLVMKGNMQLAQVPIKVRGKVVEIINSSGNVLLTTKQREGLQSVERAMSIIDTVDDASKAIHATANVPGAKWAGGLQETAQSWVSPSGNPELAALESGKAALGPIIRTLGEMGNLSEGDIARAVAAVPVSRFMTRKEAEARIKTLRDFVNAARDAIGKTAGKKGNELLQQPGTTGVPQGRAVRDANGKILGYTTDGKTMTPVAR